MNLSPIDNSNIRKKQISLLTNSTHYLLDSNKDLDEINNFKSYTFYLDSNYQNNQKKQIESYINTLVENKISDQNNGQLSNNEENIKGKENNNANIINQSNENQEQNQSLVDNEEKYNLLMIKYKELVEENKALKNTIKKNELTIEEQNGIILLLKTNIENEFFRNNDVKKFISIGNLVDFIKLKKENEEYKKGLVLSQALVNSLQSENQQLIKEKEKENKNLINKNNEENKDIDIESGYSNNTESLNFETEDFLSNSENKTNLNLKENDLINELVEENNQLKKIVQEATVKLNYLIINEKQNKVISDNNNILNMELSEKINLIKEYEEKFDFFNSYISEIKSSFINMQNKIINHINIYNKMANDDLNSLLSNSFSQNLMKFSLKIGNLIQIEPYNLESRPELEVHEILLEYLSAINDEFLILYEKVYQTNNYYKESNNKIFELEREINENKKKFINNNEFNYADKLINDGGDYKNEYIKTINKLNLELSLKENENYYMKEISNNFKKDLEEVIDILNMLNKIISDKKRIKSEEINISSILNNYIDNLKKKINLMIEKEKAIEKMNRNNYKIKNLKLENKLNSFNNLNFYKEEHINNIIKDYDKRIREKQDLLFMNKEKLNLLIIQSYKAI